MPISACRLSPRSGLPGLRLAPLLAVALAGRMPLVAQAGQDAIKIGVMADMSGFAADVGGPGAVLAARMAIDDAGGRVLGKPIQLLSADMQNKPDVGASIARQWFDRDGVDAIADLPVSSVALAVQSVGRDMKKVLLISAAATTELTGKQCSPTTIHWADDTNALSVGTAGALTQAGGREWFFVTADFAFGQAMEKAAATVIEANGGKVLGAARHPLGTTDFSSYLLQAQSSNAKVIGLANVGADTIASIKQAAEFGLGPAHGQTLLGFIMFITDVHSLGLPVAKGIYVTANYYWDENEASRAFAGRFIAAHGKMPTKEQANTYAAVAHYIKGLAKAGTDQGEAVTAAMKALPIDAFGKTGSIRADGRALYDLSLWQVKTPAESTKPWDYYKKIRTIPADQAFKPLDGSCPFVKP